MLKIEIGEPVILKRVHVQDLNSEGETMFWAHIDLYNAGEHITLVSDGEFGNSLYDEFQETYRGMTEEEAIEKFVSYMKEDE